jgi:hypothetical protein
MPAISHGGEKVKYAYFDVVDVPWVGAFKEGRERRRCKLGGGSGSGTGKGGEGNVEGVERELGGRRRVEKVEDENRINVTRNASGWRSFHAG